MQGGPFWCHRAWFRSGDKTHCSLCSPSADSSVHPCSTFKVTCSNTSECVRDFQDAFVLHFKNETRHTPDLPANLADCSISSWKTVA